MNDIIFRPGDKVIITDPGWWCPLYAKTAKILGATKFNYDTKIRISPGDTGTIINISSFEGDCILVDMGEEEIIMSKNGLRKLSSEEKSNPAVSERILKTRKPLVII